VRGYSCQRNGGGIWNSPERLTNEILNAKGPNRRVTPLVPDDGPLLVEAAAYYGFDGWLWNVESNLRGDVSVVAFTRFVQR
jgi:hypothetical protein